MATLILTIRDRRGPVAGTTALDADVSFKAAAAGIDPNVDIIGDMKPQFSEHAATCHGKLEHRVVESNRRSSPKSPWPSSRTGAAHNLGCCEQARDNRRFFSSPTLLCSR
ncbi:hypothetical protein [Chelatococcus reniformis]|uniref:Uncharacterized protein n=1 Tax=Chelatococcus reniformis TaxID=1494448 RepID=A0A916XJ00_9HYPH|nr:hypothetical protein [Chelatococcus reniformis]GGC76834.1 hypothetical protein GCM10010994_38920 [Chelatococcus reniformis]